MIGDDGFVVILRKRQLSTSIINRLNNFYQTNILRRKNGGVTTLQYISVYMITTMHYILKLMKKPISDSPTITRWWMRNWFLPTYYLAKLLVLWHHTHGHAANGTMLMGHKMDVFFCSSIVIGAWPIADWQASIECSGQIFLHAK
jgi:hypothetical protein